MPQYIVLALAGAVAYVGFKMLKRAMDAQGSLREVTVPVRSLQLVRCDDGVYRPIEIRR